MKIETFCSTAHYSSSKSVRERERGRRRCGDPHRLVLQALFHQCGRAALHPKGLRLAGQKHLSLAPALAVKTTHTTHSLTLTHTPGIPCTQQNPKNSFAKVQASLSSASFPFPSLSLLPYVFSLISLSLVQAHIFGIFHSAKLKCIANCQCCGISFI